MALSTLRSSRDGYNDILEKNTTVAAWKWRKQGSVQLKELKYRKYYFEQDHIEPYCLSLFFSWLATTWLTWELKPILIRRDRWGSVLRAHRRQPRNKNMVNLSGCSIMTDTFKNLILSQTPPSHTHTHGCVTALQALALWLHCFHIEKRSACESICVFCTVILVDVTKIHR